MPEYEDIEDLLRKLKQAIAAKYGVTALHTRVWVLEAKHPMAWIFPRNGEALPPVLPPAESPKSPNDTKIEMDKAAEREPEDARGGGLSRVVLDILRTLREVGRPLSRTRLLEEMGKRGMDWSERTVATYLKMLMDDGTIENPEDARPRGYRLTETEGDDE